MNTRKELLKIQLDNALKTPPNWELASEIAQEIIDIDIPDSMGALIRQQYKLNRTWWNEA